MLSAAMVVQEQHGCNGSTSALQIPLDKDTPNANGIQLKEQFNSGDDSTPKARKPYTITKQRERWTEEEHKKFLEALKLYGRAWRKIEEHVGTKTAVQIRSHAQKFFSKVVRESNTGEGNPVKPIEIPPPRPKRKPMHPYPRKLIYPVKTRVTVPENPTMSASPSTLERENQSPTSVLSAVGSDSSVGAYSCMPNGSPSSASSALALDVFDSEVPKRVVLEEDIISSLPDREEKNSCADEQIHLELDLSSQDTASDKQDSNESATRSLKLFGKTLLINSTCMPESIDKTKGTHLLPWSVVPLELPPNAFSDRSPTLVYNPMDDAACQVPFPWLKICSDASYLTLEVHNPTPVKAQALCDKKEEMFNDEQKEDVYSTGSNTDLVGKRWDVDSYSRLSPQRKGKEEKSFSSYKLSRKMSGSSVNSRRGFVPYKRCSAEQDSSISQETGEEREKPLIRLCL